MRQIRRISGVCLVAGVVVLTACGDDDDGITFSESSSFCHGFRQLYEEAGGVDIELGEEQGFALIDRLNDLDPPAAIAEDYRVVVDFLERTAENGGTVPVSSMDQFDEFTAAAERLYTFVEDECGLSVT